MKGWWGSAEMVCVVIFLLAWERAVMASGGNLSVGVQGATVLVMVDRSIARVGDNFVCATLDWWPPDKCDYGSCSWGHSSLLNLDLTNPILQQAVKGLSPLLRLGGTLQDKVFYDVSNLNLTCKQFVREASLFGFSEGCLTMSRWQSLNEFFHETGSQVAFGLNALFGRETNILLPWNSSNARDFVQFTADHGYPIYAWELGNELNGIGVKISASRYASDAKELRILVNEIYSGSAEKPLVVAPDGFFDQSWFRDLLKETGPQVLDACTYHTYNLGPGSRPANDLQAEILDPAFYERGAGMFYNVNKTLRTYGPWVQAWVGESGGAYNSGQNLVSHSFLSSFWYLNQLGLAASYNTQVYCRQTLVGGNYGLLNTTTFHPNPDYYIALLWKKLMGNNVLAVETIGSSYLKAFAHCSTGDTHSISVALINLSDTISFQVHFPMYNPDENNGVKAQSPAIRLSIFGDLFSRKPRRREAIEFQNKRLEYHLTVPDGNLRSQTIFLNGNVLQMAPNGDLPDLTPLPADKSQPVIIAPTSIAFMTIPDVLAPACLLVQTRVHDKQG